MHFDKRVEGPYRIYAGAVQATQGRGYCASVVVSRNKHGSACGREAYREEGLACRHCWEFPDEALIYAVARGREIIARQPQMLSG